MERWIGKTAVVTGASAGIGAATCIELAKAGFKVVGLARRAELVDELKTLLPVNSIGELHSYKCDVAREEDIKAAFSWIEETFGGTDVLVNNAGIAKPGNIIDPDNSDIIRQTVDVNIVGVAFCTREAFQSMKRRNVDGHVILINSVVGHIVPYTVASIGSTNVYQATKHAVTAMTEVLRQEFLHQGTKVKVTVSGINAN